MEKILFELALQAFSGWVREIDNILENGELHFQEFSGHGQRRELQEAGEALARAEACIREARAALAKVIIDEPIAEPGEEWFEESFGQPAADPEFDEDFPSGEFPLD